MGELYNMALSSAIVWEVRTTGAITNGGGFKTGASGTDWSQQTSPQYSITDAVTAGTTTITSATANFGTDVVGNVLYIQGGTGSITAGWYEITVRNSSTSITVDRSTGLTTGTGATLKIGGCISTLSTVSPIVVAGNTVYVKNGTYSETLTLTVSGNATSGPITWSGYNSSRNDQPSGTNRPFIDAASTRTYCISLGTIDANIFEYFRVASATGDNINGGTSTTATTIFRFCKTSSSANYGINTIANLILFGCEISLNTKDGVIMQDSAGGASIFGCSFHNNTGRGMLYNAGLLGRDDPGTADFCLFYANANFGLNVGFAFSVRNCTSTANTGATSDGFLFQDSNNRSYPNVMCTNNISTANGRFGFRRTSATQGRIGIFDYNCYFNNTSANLSNITAGPHDTTSDPSFASATNLAVGTSMRALGYPGTFPDGVSIGFLDLGAVQRQEAGFSVASLFTSG